MRSGKASPGLPNWWMDELGQVGSNAYCCPNNRLRSPPSSENCATVAAPSLLLPGGGGARGGGGTGDCHGSTATVGLLGQGSSVGIPEARAGSLHPPLLHT